MTETVKAPWIRPGVVVHDPFAPVDELLGNFARLLQKRGFRVAGFAKSASLTADGNQFIDLSTDAILTIDDSPTSAELAETILRKAVHENIDLLVISNFSTLEQAVTVLMETVADGIQRGLPIITSIADHELFKWRSFAGRSGAMVGPTLDALWQWWGADRLYQDLVLGVAETEVLNIACGPRWILVEGPTGCGISYLPRNPKELLTQLPTLRRKSLRELAGLVHSWDAIEMALGIAAINAYYNTYDLTAHNGNGTLQFRGFKGRSVVIGAFPGLSETLPDAQIIETDPRPGELPTVAMDTVLPGCEVAVVTSSSLVNRTLPRILRQASGARVAMIGPSTPLTPRLFGYGIDTLGGLIVTDSQGLAKAIQAGALPREFARFSKYVHVKRGAVAQESGHCGLKDDSTDIKLRRRES